MSDPITPHRPHDDAEQLLPWYVTGQLDAPERERVEAHLAACANCRDELVLERRRMQAFRSFSPQVESGWKRLRAHIAVPAPDARRPRLSIMQAVAGLRAALAWPAILALATAQLIVLTLGAGILLWMSRPAYQTLGSSTAPASADLIVMFRSDSTAQDVRGALQAAGAQVVGGPTATGAYLIHVDPARRDAALVSLRSDDKVQLAQPIDSGDGK